MPKLLEFDMRHVRDFVGGHRGVELLCHAGRRGSTSDKPHRIVLENSRWSTGSISYDLAAGNILGECPIWSPEEGALYWVDILGRAVHRFAPASGERRTWPVPEEIGAIGFREGGGLVAACRDGFYLLDLDTGDATRLVDPEPDRPEHRFNDGRVDRAGRFWAGTMHDDHVTASGALCRSDSCRCALTITSSTTSLPSRVPFLSVASFKCVPPEVWLATPVLGRRQDGDAQA
jgi:hypothetical protein